MEGITDEQQAILQNIAWEAVSKYRHAGWPRERQELREVFHDTAYADCLPGLA